MTHGAAWGILEVLPQPVLAMPLVSACPRALAALALAAAACAVLVAAGRPAAAQAPARPLVLTAELDGAVNAGVADHLRDAVAAGQREGAAAVLIRVDTPGGLLSATRALARTLLTADVPILVWVGPSGARAGSAGVFLVLAGHVAAMAPGTNIGAAHPVAIGGGGERQTDETMDRKLAQDTAAFARAIAEVRGRNAAWAERAVLESASATADEAVAANVVDLVVASPEALLEAAHGRVVTLPSGPVTLSTRGAALRAVPMTVQQRVLTLLGDPNLAYLLFMLGILLALVELSNPGLIVPGALAVLCFILAGLGFDLLPVNAGGVVLILAAVGLFVAEVYVTSFGLLALGGVACLVVGSMLLMDTTDPEFYVEPSFGLSWGVVVPTVVVVTGIVAAFIVMAARSGRARSTTGHEGMLGETGHARTPIGPDGGAAFLHGEIWRAVSDVPIPAGASIEVVAIDGLTVRVVPVRPPRPVPEQ